MGQIARRKKKGRPSKADLARRSGESPAAAQPDLRRSLRRRNVRYNVIEYDDDYVDEEEDERMREKKKLKLMVKLNGDEEEEGEAREQEDEEEEEEEEESHGQHAPLEGGGGGGGRGDGDEIGGQENEDAEDEEDMVKGRKVDLKGLHCVSGTPPNPPPGIPLPDKRTLELILDKLQKKDTYGVFAEPVDPEELPDYHDVIKHPMDFATVRKNLANGSYPTLEQFESDIFLICSNAMQYNAPETIYHKQARSIQELGRKKFEKLRIDFERAQVELKPDQKVRSNSLIKKQAKRALGCASQEPVGSDFSSGATLATIGDVQPTSYPMQGGSYERPGNIDGIVEGNVFLIDGAQEKAEDVLPGRGLSKLGRKSFVFDEDRRASYNMSNQPIIRSDSMFMTFENELKQLVTVGLHAEYSYARSLARFCATLGPTAWKFASHRIQQALPAGCKFGCGWVGEYESLPTPVLIFDNCVQKDSSLVSKLHFATELMKGDKNFKNVEHTVEHPLDGQMFEGKQSSVIPASGLASEGKTSLFGAAGIRPDTPVNLLNQKQNVPSRNSGYSESQGLNQVGLNSAPTNNQNNSSLALKFRSNVPTALSKPREMIPRNINTVPSNGVVSGEFPNGKVMNSSLNRQVSGLSSESTSNQASSAAPHVVHGQEQNFSDPVQLMRMFAEKTQKQQTSNDSSGDTQPVTQPDRAGQRDDSANASAAAARAWMSVGTGVLKQGLDNSNLPKNQISADSLHNFSREFHRHVSQTRGDTTSGATSFKFDKNNFPFEAVIPRGAVSQLPNRPMVAPQVASAEPSRFQKQPPWRGLSPRSQPRQKQEALPPDLNIGFQSPGSPVKQSSGVIGDTQQPDLALQL